ncbi:MAG: VCBS repeat-containing protein, partial [Planctomycetes bacterium]|nr:VCBS repeat-containing protein [Planctomycetota bacterium]
PGGEQSRLLLNGGTGIFTEVTTTNLPTFLIPTRGVALGDVDGDGDLDAFLANYGGDRLYLNGGAGVFTNGGVNALPALFDDTYAVALGDVDGDGDLDAFTGNSPLFVSGGGRERLYLNVGMGAFVDVTGAALPNTFDPTRAVALGDMDGDGDLDALTGNASSVSAGGVNRLFLNGGTGFFTDATVANLPALLNDTQAVALGDVDEDGDLDAFVGNGSSDVDQNLLYLNGGTGVFADATAANLPALLGYTLAVALGDVDGDGDLDAFAGNYGKSWLYTNLTRQVVWRGTPRTGKPLVLDIRGPGNGAWALGAALSSANVLLPPFGILRLDPLALFIAGGGPLDPQGRASLSLLVPASPALVGVSVYWQALVGPPLLFANLEITTATDL